MSKVGTVEFYLFSISRAWFKVASVIFAPPSIRAISLSRFSWLNELILVRVRPLETLLVTRKWWIPNFAICGRWVMQITWWCRDNSDSFWPTISATLPPIPASTSSKIKVSTESVSAKMAFNASTTRESSPPDAILASGLSASPMLGAI